MTAIYIRLVVKYLIQIFENNAIIFDPGKKGDNRQKKRRFVATMNEEAILRNI